MRHFRYGLQATAAFGTPITSGGLWGHLAWAKRYLAGEEPFQEWLSRQVQNPWRLSSAFPAGLLPRPVLPSVAPRHEDAGALRRARRQRMLPFVRREQFLYWLRSSDRTADGDAALDEAAADVKAGAAGLVPGNAIDRRTGVVREEGGLYFRPTVRVDAFDLYVGLPERDVNEFETLLELVGSPAMGYGARAGIGYGGFECIRAREDVASLFAPPAGRMMSLSHGVLTPDMHDARYQVQAIAGRLGGSFSSQSSMSPFKYPVLLLRPGATFAPGPSPASLGIAYGAMLGGESLPVHAESRIRQHAVHLAVPIPPWP